MDSWDLSHAHFEFLGLIVMAWNALKKEVVQMERPQKPMTRYKTTFQPTSVKNVLLQGWHDIWYQPEYYGQCADHCQMHENSIYVLLQMRLK
jgi:hypothetical protein